MENEKLDNELIINNDVPETSEESEQIETSTSEGVEEVQETTEKVEEPVDIQAQIEETVKDRLARDRASRERKQAREMAKYKQLENVIKTGLGVDSLDEAISKSSEFYRGQGINIPIQTETSLNERDAMILAKADAQDVIKCGKEEMEAEANRIASIPEKNRSLRDKTIFNDLCQELIRINDEESFKQKGYDTKILEDKDFSLFRKQFNLNTPVANIYEIYSKLNAKPVEKPASAGSAKSENNNSGEMFSVERINNMKPEEMAKYWNNPVFRKIAGLN